MARTPAEKATNDAIEMAIDAYRKAYMEANPEDEEVRYGTLVDWIVVAAETKPDLNGEAEDDITAYSFIMPGGSIPWYRARGLLEAGITYLRLTEDG